MGKKIVVVGAGYAGILTAKKLEKKLKRHKDVEITIIDKNPFHTMLTELHEVAAWRVEEDSIKISLDKVFAGRNVKVVLDTIKNIDYTQKLISGEAGTYNYDYMVLATGSQPTFFGMQGVKEHAFTLWSYEDAVKLREHIMEMFRKAACETDLEKKKQFLTFYTVGAGFTGVEMAGELAELVPYLCQRFEIDPKMVKMVNVDVLDRVVPILPNKLSEKVHRRLEKMNVQVKLSTKVLAVGEDYIETESGGRTQKDKSHTIIWTAGIEGSEIAKASEDLGIVGRGRIQTDEYLRSQNDKNIYVGGDNIFFIPEGETSPVPQMVENCEACAHTIAHNLVCDITGSGTPEKYAPKFHGVMVCIGGRYGVAHVGMPGKFFALPSFFAMLSKHFINIIYFLQVLGWNKIFSYMYHEFFTIRKCRSFVGGHLSNRSTTAFVVPLRLYLGAYWIYEAGVKALDGWFNTPKLAGTFTWASGYYASLLGIDTGDAGDAAAASTAAATGAEASVADTAAAGTAAATGAVEAAVETAAATAAATGATDTAAVVEAVSPVLFDLNLGLARTSFFNLSEGLAFRLTVPMMDWFLETFVISNPSIAMFFQVSILLAEFAVGLALIAGLFTTLSGVVSIGLLISFATSTGVWLDSWWMLFASIAVMFGSGRVLGLDYYVMPWLKERWKSIKFVKKWYLYND